MASANLFAQYLRPPKSVADYTAEMDEADLRREQIAGTRQQNALAALALQDRAETTRLAGQKRNALQQIASGWTPETSMDQRIASLRSNPLTFGDADTLEKGYLERQKTEAEVGSKKASTTREQGATLDDAMKRYRGALDFIDTPEGAVRWLRAQYVDPVLGEHLSRQGTFEEKAATIPRDPQGFAQWRQQAALGMEKFLEQQRLQATQAETVRHNQATEGLTRRGQDVTASTTRRGQDMTDARQRELNTTVKADKEASRKTEQTDKAVTKFSDTIQKEGIPELETAIAGAEGALGRYKKGEVPGVGRVAGAVPSALLSDEGNDVRQSIASVRNIVLNARSGAAVTDSELRRLVEELGTGLGQSEDALRRGLAKVRARLDVIKTNAAAGVSDDVLNTYRDRGGMDIRRGNAPASNIDALLKKYGQ